MPVQPIRFGDEGQLATRELLQRFEAARPEVARHLRTFDALDRQYGGAGAIPVEDAGDLVDAALTEMARLESTAEFAELTLGIALWALRHGVPMRAVEPVANALARRSNAAASRQELAAVFGLMQGVIAHVAPLLAADLERSNPERPWRVLHANYAITAIRTEDPLLMGHAFDALDAALPDERGSFYAEALALAMNPRIAPEVREALEARHRAWSQGT
jgi:hypothetical protein